MESLDVGCGEALRGYCDVNLDLNVNEPNPHIGYRTIDPHKIKNFVLADCDGYYLPFKDNAFPKVYCHHVLEHINDPQGLLSELIRVSSDYVEVKTPHRLGEGITRRLGKWQRTPFHKWSFRQGWFKKVLEKYNLRMVDSYISMWNYHPTEYFCIFRLPREITVVIHK